MTITKTVYPERVLIVLHPDGSMKGAHVEAMEVIAEDGEPIAPPRMLPAAPLDAEALAGVLPDSAALLSQVQALTIHLLVRTDERDAAVAQWAAVTEQIAALHAQLAAVTAERDAAVAAAAGA
jgi:hypothetical protein